MPLKIFIVLLISILLSNGQPNSNTRIFRGTDATKNKFPWYIQITLNFPNRNKKEFYSQGGGVLISMKHILTVSHLFFAIGDILILHKHRQDFRLFDPFCRKFYSIGL